MADVLPAPAHRSPITVARRACAWLRSAVDSPWVRLGGSALGVLVLVRSVDLGQAARQLREASLGWSALGLALSALVVLGSVFEWGVLLRVGPGHLLSWRRLSSWYLQGLFVGQVLPAGVGGDAMRAVEVGRITGHGHALASLAGSRMAGTLGMAAWGVAGAVLLRAWIGPAAVIGACAFMVGMVVAWVLALGADRVVRRLRDHACPIRRRVHRALHPFTGAFRAYGGSFRVVVKSVLVGAAGWGLNLCALAVFARALGIEADWSLFAVAIPLTLVATLAPFSLNGIGLREGVLVALLAHAGVSSVHAGALSLIVDLQMIPFALLGAVLWMRRPDRGAPHGPVPALATAA